MLVVGCVGDGVCCVGRGSSRAGGCECVRRCCRGDGTELVGVVLVLVIMMWAVVMIMTANGVTEIANSQAKQADCTFMFFCENE